MFRFAMCNEAFEGRPFDQVCRLLKGVGYDGIEIAPFTLANDPLDITAAQRAEYRQVMADEGIAFAGLHWLLVTKKPIHVSTPDQALREASWQHVRNLVDLCADLAGNGQSNGVMVFGSPKQRSSTGGLTPEEAKKNFIDGLASVAPHAESRGVTILMEALPGSQSDVVQRLAEAAEVVRQVGSVAVQTMFDTHNAEDETEAHDALIEEYFDVIRHVHVNEMDGRHPGTGDYDFGKIFRKLRQLGYGGWVSVEAFDFSYGGERIAQESIDHLRRVSE